MRKYALGAIFGLVLGSVSVAMSKPPSPVSQTPAAQPATPTPVRTPVPAFDLVAKCTNGTTHVSSCLEGKCTPRYSYPCFPFECDAAGKACRDTCVSSHDCWDKGVGAHCNTISGRCAPFGNQCADSFTIQASDGQLSSCSPYRCEAGACQANCQGGIDCNEGYKCQSQRCVKK